MESSHNSTMSDASNPTPVSSIIDESLYSRQLYHHFCNKSGSFCSYVLGHEAMQKMTTSDVLILGLNGLGVEIGTNINLIKVIVYILAKNVILAGVRSVTLWDDRLTTVSDLSTQYYLSEADIGKPRAACCRENLAELNDYVPVKVLEGLLPCSEEALAPYKVVVLCDQSLSNQLAINDITHSLNTCFVAADTFGLFATTFCDFGTGFVVSDQTGEPPVSGIVGGVTHDEDGIVTMAEEHRHGLETGDYVTFHEVKGMTQLNECIPVPVKVLGPYTFSIGNTTKMSPFEHGSGVFEQVKQPRSMNFKSLRESLSNPEFLISDFAKIDRQTQLHAGIQALQQFIDKEGRCPRPRNAEDAEKVLNFTKALIKDEPVDEKLIRELSYQSTGSISPMTTFMGGFVAQELLKACSGKFTPLFQHLYFDSLESLPQNVELTEADCAPSGSRYDAQIAVFGRRHHEKLENLRVFLVGAGAIGCELLKVFGMMGVGSGPKGYVEVTDMDNIEKSNLNRQFLFRPLDVGKPKSKCAAEAIYKLNPKMQGHINYRTDRVGVETEHIFGDQFFTALDFVANALDNVDARRYVDRRCVYYEKPLLESGTLGTKGNTQVVFPHLTESYSSSQDPPDKMVPVCTLHHFPNSIEHTIEWAMDAFHGTYRLDHESINRYLSSPKEFVESLKANGVQPERIEAIVKNLVTERPVNFDQCIVWARLRFESLFANNIKQLLFNFPRDYKTRNGEPFWSGPKRAPHPLTFDPHNGIHLSFVISAANLRAYNYGLKGIRDSEVFLKALETIAIPDFVPKTNVQINISDEQEKKTEICDDCDLLIQALPDPSSLAGYRVCPIEFEKDDDTNFHIDWVAATANLRAMNYDINPADRHKIKGIAGKIIPAIATTTALVAGLVGLEACKVIDGESPIERYKNGFANLALPFFGFSEPIAAPKSQFGEATWTLWDRFELPDMTLAELLEHFRTKHNLEVTMLNYGPSMLFGFIRQKEKIAERMQMKLSALVEHISKKPIPEHLSSIVLDLLAEDEEGNDVEVPFIKLALSK